MTTPDMDLDLEVRRAALQLVVQLPENQDDALLILSAAKEFVLKFMGEHYRVDDLPRREAVVLTLASALDDRSA